MKRAASVAAILILVLAGTAAFAACPGACARPVGVQCPQPCAAPCPQPCPKPCPQACPKPCPATCCPASVPASIGAGPDLAGLECPDFDPAYARKLYEQNATIIAVTEFGGQRASNGNLRDISGEIRDRLMGANQKLAAFYGGCGCLTADPSRAQAIIADLYKETGQCFDVAYAKTLSALVKQSQAADEQAGVKAVNGQMKQQAQFMSDKDSDWAFRLDRWVTDHGYTA